VTPEPEQRYWRRRANRRVRKARLTHNLGYWSAVIALNLMIAGVLIYIGVRTFERLRNSGEFALETIEIAGSQRASAEAIRQRLAPFVGVNLFDLDLREIESLVASDPWVARASIKRELPDRLRVGLVERTPCAVAVILGQTHLVDETGYVIGLTGPGLADDLPVLTGLAEEREPLIADLRRGVASIRRLRRASERFNDNISELDLSRGDRITVRTIDPGPLLLLDPRRIERNVLEYLEIGGSFRNQLGAVDYIDLRWQDKISVMPAMNGKRGN
jgi:cell division protein FtsQ